MGLSEDAWLSERFGHPAFTLSVEGDPEAEVRAALEHAGAEGASFHARIPAERPDLAALLTRAGFEVVSVGLTLARAPTPVPGAPDSVEVRPGDPQADTAVLDIAERSFTMTRFHLDRSIPDEIADRVKRDWAENSLNGKRGDGMLVAVGDDGPIGFLAGISTDDDDGRAHVIDLIATAPGSRNAGAGQALVSRFIEESGEGYERVLVTTQAANPGATRFYERLGFVSDSAVLDLHLHVGVWSQP